MAAPTPPGSKKKEIYKYIAPWTVYGMNWSVRQDKRFRIAFGSFIEDYSNKVSKFYAYQSMYMYVVRSQLLNYQLPKCQLPKCQLPKCQLPKCQLFKIKVACIEASMYMAGTVSTSSLASFRIVTTTFSALHLADLRAWLCPL